MRIAPEANIGEVVSYTGQLSVNLPDVKAQGDSWGWESSGEPSATTVRTPTCRNGGLAERVGFEPTRGLRPYALSRRACSTTPAPLLGGGEGGIRTHDTTRVYRFSRAAPSATRPPLLHNQNIAPYLAFQDAVGRHSSKTRGSLRHVKNSRPQHPLRP